jgi:hypothetical protein
MRVFDVLPGPCIKDFMVLAYKDPAPVCQILVAFLIRDKTMPGKEMKIKYLLFFLLIIRFTFFAAGCREIAFDYHVEIPDQFPVSGKIIDVPLLKQGDFECGPASLAMYTCYLAGTKGTGKCRTSKEVREDLVTLNSEYFWITYDSNNIPRPIYPSGDELPVIILPANSMIPFTLTEGYVIKGVDTLSGTYPEYLEKLALTYYSETGLCVVSFYGGNTTLLKQYIDDNVPVIVDIWAHGCMEPGYNDNKSYTHFVVVIGYEEHGIIINDPYSFSRIMIDYTSFENAWCKNRESGAPHAPDYRQGWGMVICSPGL